MFDAINFLTSVFADSFITVQSLDHGWCFSDLLTSKVQTSLQSMFRYPDKRAQLHLVQRTERERILISWKDLLYLSSQLILFLSSQTLTKKPGNTPLNTTIHLESFFLIYLFQSGKFKKHSFRLSKTLTSAAWGDHRPTVWGQSDENSFLYCENRKVNHPRGFVALWGMLVKVSSV